MQTTNHQPSNKKLLYCNIALSQEDSSSLKTDYQAIAYGKNPRHIELALAALNEANKKPFLYESQNDLIINAPNTHSFTIALWCNEDEIIFYKNSGFYGFKMGISPVFTKEDIQRCIPINGFNRYLALLCHNINTLEKLSILIESIFNAHRNDCIIITVAPYNTPFLLSKKIERLTTILYGNSETYHKNLLRKDTDLYKEVVTLGISDDQPTLESVESKIKVIASHMAEFKNDLKQHLQTQQIANRDLLIQLLHNFELLEDCLCHGFISTDEYKNSSQHDASLEKKRLGFIPLETPILAEKTRELTEMNMLHKPNKIPDVGPTNYRYSSLLCEKSINMEQFPVSHDIRMTSSDCLVIGDLHGHAMKFIYFLLHENIMTGITSEEYTQLFEIYNYSIASKITNKAYDDQFSEFIQAMSDKIDLFKKIVAKLVPVNQEATPAILMLGDIFADRGENDYFTLLIFLQLKIHQIFPRVLISNHDMDLLTTYEAGWFNDFTTPNWAYAFSTSIFAEQTRSMMNLGVLLKAGIVSKEEIIYLIEEVYLPLLRCIDLNIAADEKQIHLFTHAPVGLSIVTALAKQFKISYDEETALKSVESIGELAKLVNIKFQELVRNRKVSDYYTEKSALYYLVWNRASSNDTRNNMQLPENWSIVCVHGHDGRGSGSKKIRVDIFTIDLDNMLGLPPGHSGDYRAYYCGNNPLFIDQRICAFTIKSAPYLKNSFFGNTTSILAQIPRKEANSPTKDDKSFNFRP